MPRGRLGRGHLAGADGHPLRRLLQGGDPVGDRARAAVPAASRRVRREQVHGVDRPADPVPQVHDVAPGHRAERRGRE